MITQCFSSEDSSHRRIFEWNDAQRKIIEARFAGTLGLNAKPAEPKKPATGPRKRTVYRPTQAKTSPELAKKVTETLDKNLVKNQSGILGFLKKLRKGEMKPGEAGKKLHEAMGSPKNSTPERTLRALQQSHKETYKGDKDAVVDGKVDNKYTQAVLLVKLDAKAAKVPNLKDNPALGQEHIRAAAVQKTADATLSTVPGATQLPDGTWTVPNPDAKGELTYFKYVNGKVVYASENQHKNDEWYDVGTNQYERKGFDLTNRVAKTLQNQGKFHNKAAELLKNGVPQDDGSLKVELGGKTAYFKPDEGMGYKWQSQTERDEKGDEGYERVGKDYFDKENLTEIDKLSKQLREAADEVKTEQAPSSPAESDSLIPAQGQAVAEGDPVITPISGMIKMPKYKKLENLQRQLKAMKLDDVVKKHGLELDILHLTQGSTSQTNINQALDKLLLNLRLPAEAGKEIAEARTKAKSEAKEAVEKKLQPVRSKWLKREIGQWRGTTLVNDKAIEEIAELLADENNITEKEVRAVVIANRGKLTHLSDKEFDYIMKRTMNGIYPFHTNRERKRLKI